MGERHLHLQLAQSKKEYESAFRLQKESRTAFGWSDPKNDSPLWLLKQHALPSTYTIIARCGSEVLGAISLFCENPFHLPLEETTNIHLLRPKLSGKIGEISLPGLKAGHEEDFDLLFALFQFTTSLAANYCQHDHLLLKAPTNWLNKYSKALQLKAVEHSDDSALMQLNLRSNADYRGEFSREFKADFQFPEKMYFLISHHCMSADVLRYLFSECTSLFECMNDFEIRILRNIYDYGDYAKAMPKRNLELPLKALPKHPRFPMNCDGFLRASSGKKEYLKVLDVSREGLKIQIEDTLKPQAVVPLTLAIGVRKQAELIAKVMWVDEITQIAGLHVESGDQNWQSLVDYLEKELVKTAA